MKRMVFVLSTATVTWGAATFGANEPPVGADLKATILLQGKPCDQIVSSKRNGDSDYTATCKDGNRYHVFVDTQGRVVVQNL
jgi:hypothetical protein